MSNQADADARERAGGVRVPPHGRGRLAPKFEVGNPGNPGGRPAVLRDVQKLARKKSLDALHALIACYTTPDGKIARNVDGRIVVHAASTVLKWAFGEPPPYDPNADKPETKIDLSALSLAERRRLLETMDRVSVVADADATVDDGPDFDPARFGPAPVEIEHEAALDAVVVVDTPPTIAPPKRVGRPRKAAAPPKAPGRKPKNWREKAGKAATKALKEEAEIEPPHPRLHLF